MKLKRRRAAQCISYRNARILLGCNVCHLSLKKQIYISFLGLGLGLWLWLGLGFIGFKQSTSVASVHNSDTGKPIAEGAVTPAERPVPMHDLNDDFDMLEALSGQNMQNPPVVREVINSCMDLNYKEISVFNSCEKGDLLSRSRMKSKMEKIRRHVPSLGKGKVLILPNALCLGSSIHPLDITMTNQFSVEKLERFLSQVQRWNGPVSSAVYIRDSQDLLKLQSFILEHLEHLRQVSFHFYVDNTRSSSLYPYPNNVLRNIALDNIKTDYFLLMDVDLLTAPENTHNSITSLLKDDSTLVDKLNKKTLFVLPAFEHPNIIPDIRLAADYWSFPQNRREAKNMIEDGAISIFKAHFELGHGATNYTKWIYDESDISYPIRFKFQYEPYVIGAKKSIPRFYDFFRGYGLNKMSWFTELHLAGYKYEVLRDYFVFHLNHVSSYDKKEKRHQIMRNAVCSKSFIDLLLDKYGDVSDEILYSWKHLYRHHGYDFGIFKIFDCLRIFGYFRIIKW